MCASLQATPLRAKEMNNKVMLVEMSAYVCMNVCLAVCYQYFLCMPTLISHEVRELACAWVGVMQ